MTEEDIIRMAREAGWNGIYCDWLVRFARRIEAESAAAEREVCALMCEAFGLLHIAEALRYRGVTK